MDGLISFCVEEIALDGEQGELFFPSVPLSFFTS